jgi:hypothetical protein
MSENLADLVPPHLTSDFFLWMWLTSVQELGQVELPNKRKAQDDSTTDEDSNAEQEEQYDGISYYVDNRLVLHSPNAEGNRAVITGDNASSTVEGKAALSTGKMIQELQLYITVEGVEYSLGLKGPLLDFTSVKFPPVSLEGDSKHEMNANILLRMSQYDDLYYYMSVLYQHFAELRLSEDWNDFINDAKNVIYEK